MLLELLGGLGELLLCALGVFSGRLGVLEDLLNVGAREQLKDLEGLEALCEASEVFLFDLAVGAEFGERLADIAGCKGFDEAFGEGGDLRKRGECGIFGDRALLECAESFSKGTLRETLCDVGDGLEP